MSAKPGRPHSPSGAAREDKILDDALAEPGVAPAPARNDVVVSIPDEGTARQVLEINAPNLVAECWVSRQATVYDIGKAHDPTVPPDHTLFVVFPRTAACPANAGWVAPACRPVRHYRRAHSRKKRRPIPATPAGSTEYKASDPECD
ncbi:MAG: hypothetical protein R2706_19610 [Acidimicrobiales bacterium]